MSLFMCLIVDWWSVVFVCLFISKRKSHFLVIVFENV